MQHKPTIEPARSVFGDTQSISSGSIAHALLKKLNQLLALLLT